MRLSLTSAAINVIDELTPLLPIEADEHIACYITTAGNLESNPYWIDEEIGAMEQAGIGVTRVDLAQLSPGTVEESFDDCDSIWVGGGNTYLLLQEVRFGSTAADLLCLPRPAAIPSIAARQAVIAYPTAGGHERTPIVRGLAQVNCWHDGKC